MTNSSRQSSTKSQNPVFVPSPRWLSESPANRGAPGHVDYPGQGSISDHSQTPSFARNLRSPIPPPPANLYPGTPAAFNVDPGIPFLATAGPTEDGSSDNGSIKDEEPPQRGFGGGIVSGIKNVVRRSLRDRARSQQHENPSLYIQPPQFRDSGYADSPPQHIHPRPPSGLPPMPDFSYASSPPSSRRTVYSVRPPSETLLGHPEERDDRDEATVIGHQNSMSMGKQKRKSSYHEPRPHHQTPQQQYIPETPPPDERQRPQGFPEIVPPEAIASPVSAELQFGPGYLQMNLVTPPPSETSLNTYLRRFQKFVHDVNDLPWSGKGRITKDYYPERSRRSDEPKHHPAIVWRSEGFTKLNYPASDPETSSDFDDTTSSISGGGPGLRAPRKGSYTAMDLDAEFEGNYTPMPLNPPNMSPSDVRTRGMPTDIPAPSNSMLLRSGPPPSLPSAPALPVPASINVVYEAYPPNPPPNGPWNDIKVPQFYIPPSYVAPTSDPKGSPTFYIPFLPADVPSAQSLYTPSKVHHIPKDDRPGEPSRKSRRRSSKHNEWEEYPREMTGYVPYQYAEHYYGDQYGSGIHAARPPVAPPPLSGPSSTTSLRQPNAPP